MRPYLLLLITLFVGSLAAPAFAAEPRLAEIHLSQDGDDRAAGSASRPWKTLKQALARVAPGGRIVLGTGVWYEGELMLEQSGTPAQPLVIEGAGADRTWIAGSKPVTGWTKDRSGVWSVPWTVNSQVVACDGVPLQQVGSGSRWHGRMEWGGEPALKPVGSGVRDVQPGRFFADGKRLHLRLADDGDPNAHRIEASAATWVLRGGVESRQVVIRNLGLRHCNGSAKGSDGYGTVLTLGPEAWTVEDCTIILGDFCGIETAGLHHRIRRTRIADNGALGLSCNNDPGPARTATAWPAAPLHDLRIEDCTITGNNTRRFDYNWHAGGMKLIPAAHGVTVARCTVSDNVGHGIWFDSCQGGHLIEGNTVERNKAGIMVEISTPVAGDAGTAVVRGNLVHDNAEQGIYVSGSQQVLVERNTLWGNWCNLVLHGMPRDEQGADGTPIHFALRDNQVRGNLIGAAKHADLILFTGERAGDNTVDGNFYASGLRNPINGRRTTLHAGLVTDTGYDITAQSLADLAEHGIELHGVSGDPRLDPTTLAPAADGPAAGFGRPLDQR